MRMHSIGLATLHCDAARRQASTLRLARTETIADHRLIVFARDDDYFFGVLHSRAHEVWSLRMGTSLGVGNDPRYTPTTCFETFPLPWPPGQEPTEGHPDHPKVAAIAAAAADLDAKRRRWLDPPAPPPTNSKNSPSPTSTTPAPPGSPTPTPPSTAPSGPPTAGPRRRPRHGPRGDDPGAAAGAERGAHLGDRTEEQSMDYVEWCDILATSLADFADQTHGKRSTSSSSPGTSSNS